MNSIEEFLIALNSIEIDSYMTEDRLKELIEAEINGLIETYEIEQLQEVDN